MPRVLCTSLAGRSLMHASLFFDLQAAQFIEHRHGTALNFCSLTQVFCVVSTLW